VNRRLTVILVLAAACGCTEPEPTGRMVPTIKRELPPRVVLKDRVVLNFDVVTIKRASYHKLEQLKSYMETAGVYGPDETLLARNGLLVGRTDMRFQKRFQETVTSMHSNPKQVAILRMNAGGREQNFDVGDTISNETLFIWTDHAEVTGRHFRRARYRMVMRLEQVKDGVAELATSWQVRTGPTLSRSVTIASLDMHAELARGQSLVIAPVGFRGRGVGRAFLSGVDEKAVEITFFVITPTEIHQKTLQPELMDTAATTISSHDG